MDKPVLLTHVGAVGEFNPYLAPTDVGEGCPYERHYGLAGETVTNAAVYCWKEGHG
jgi:hypothetical protein